MMIGRHIRARIAGQFALSLAIAAAPQQSDDRFVSVAADRMLDVGRGAIVRDAVIVIDGDRIVAAGPRSSTAARGKLTDLGDLTLLPGLIDAHVHLTLAGIAENNANATLRAGFTTVQDLGAVDHANIRLRDAIRDGKVVGPRIVSSGPWLGRSGLTCDFQGIGVSGADAFRKRVQEDVAAGADLIKVCASGWLAQARKDPNAIEISDDEFRAAIEEAHRAGRRVAVHAMSERALGAAVAHGADVLVHAGFTAAGTIADMKKAGVRQLPTLWSLKGANPPELYEMLRAHMAKAVAQGLPIAFGTDAGVIPHGSNAAELLELESISLERAAVLRAATIDAAAAVGMTAEIGALQPGRLADIIAVRGNPLDDLRALKDVTFVMKGGRVFR